MFKKAAYSLMAKLLGLGAIVAYKADPTPTPLPIEENIQYIEDGIEAHRLDIIYPAIQTKCMPCIVNMHGGGFGLNSKDKIYRNYGLRLAGGPFAVVNINFRLSSTSIFPAQIEDALAALGFLQQYAHKCGLDMDNLFLVGDSSGAYMAAMVACVLTNEKLSTYYKVPAGISCRAVGLNCGMFDFTHFMENDIRFPMKKGIVEMLFGTPNYTELPVFAYSSVLEYITPYFPPAYVMDTEKASFAAEARRLETVLLRKNVEHELHIFEEEQNLAHAFNISGRYKESQVVMDEMFTFFVGHMR